MPTLTLIPGDNNSSFLSWPGTTVVSRFLELGADGNETISFSASASTTYYAFYNSRANDIGNADWETGNYSVELNITTALARANARVRLHRYTTLGSLVESSAFTSTQSLQTTGIKTFTFTSLDLSTTNPKNVQDRLVVEIELIIGTTAGTLAFDIGDTNAEVVTPIVGGHVLRPTPVPFDFNAVAPTLTLPLSLAVSPTAFDFNPVGPTLTLPLSLAVSPTPFVFETVSPEVVLAYDLAVSPTPIPFVAVGPTLTLPLSLAVSPTEIEFVAVAPFLSLGGALMLMISPTAIDFDAVAPTMTRPYTLPVTPTAIDFDAVAPTLTLPLSLALEPVEWPFVVFPPRMTRKSPIVPVLSRVSVLAYLAANEARLSGFTSRAAELAAFASAVAGLSHTMSRNSVAQE